MVNAILFDLDGVLYQKDEIIPGAPEAMAWVQARRIPHMFLTNTTSRPRRALVEKLGQLGISVQEDQILAPPVAAAAWLKTHVSGPIALFVSPATQEEFSALPQVSDTAEQGAAAVVVGDLGESWDFATLNRAFRLLMDNPQPVLIALGMTRYWHAPDGLRLDTAPFVVALEHATETRAVVLGKPAAPYFQTALDRLGQPASQTVMIGDDIRADIGSAQQLGLCGILVKTGKFRSSDFQHGIEPDAVLDSIADLPAWWDTQRSMASP
ncbi:MAG: TIGR01458 family HAD-type hydrolase [Gammaproteobacteria bacterium]|nr:TIGR01458 family HAD-type hydrolase [Gammaproteobacteria bacterium]MCP5458377.1 TIGR01458 family HAD-type hydrolase [Gammaproteobacteria bacterium]